MAYTFGGWDHPNDVGVVRVGSQPRRLTELNHDLLTGKTLGRVEAIPVVSSLDKRLIDAWIMTPPGFDPARKYP